MAKAISSVIGVDLGQYSLKAVLLQRKGSKLALTHFGSHLLDAPASDTDSLARNVKVLLRDLGGSAKHCVVSISSSDALIRIIEQPETPPAILRDAVRLNGMTLLNQDVKSFVLDCDQICAAAVEAEPGASPRYKYLVGGLPRPEVLQTYAAMEGAGAALVGMQLAPLSVFNAFEISHPRSFDEESFFLVDVGHASSTVIAGRKKELLMVRSIDFGGRSLLEALTGLSGEGADAVFEGLNQEDEVMVEYTRVAINTLTREIGSSIGFLEARHEDPISRVYVTGGPAKSSTFLKLMSEELGMPCEAWCVADHFENALPANRQEDFEREKPDLNVACGAAAEALTSK